MPETNQDATPPQEPLLARLFTLLEGIKDRTASPEVEQWLNREYGVQSDLYQQIAQWVKRGVQDGWAANLEIDGPRYRRSLLSAPCEKTCFFSITVVLMDSAGNTQGHPEDSFRGHFHAHPYGEFNMVFPLDDGAALRGLNGWCHGGWTSPDPGSRHYPEVKGGAVISLTFLPAGRISFDVSPQP
ncbi:DUF4863 family protein [Caballeronia sp. LZ035]|uniref:4-hydroxylaminobenzoate lyase n=1 Tax=Caballeronia sp. LZ035 TaxID=3038568 RepID=UPI00285FA952|nr:DUF4863 family protein [Caballeronia sp. LZ035]MDR5761215.1 DUF4863 family protein [Caballeronia sp. LZ035]